MATITYSISKVTSKDGRRKVSINFTEKQYRKRIPFDFFLEKTDIDRRGRIVNFEKLKFIEDTVNEFRQRLFHLGTRAAIMTPNAIFDSITKIQEEKELPDFFDYAEDTIARMKIKGKKNYISMLNALKKYARADTLHFDEINVRFLNGFQNFLNDKPRAKTLYLAELRHLHNMAQLEFNDESNILISPYLWQKFRVPRQAMKGGRAIDVSYIRLFAGLHPLTTRARMARDVFLLSFMLMGMNSVDMFGTDLKLKDGRICYHRAKTSDRRQDGAYIEVAIPLVASKIISRYYDRSRVFNFHRKYSTSADFNRAINIGLHVILPDLNKMAASGGLAPLDKLQFYQARHSWASIARNDCRIDKSTVGEGLNHVERDTRITDIYIKKDFNLINEANDRIQHFVWGDMVVD